jgi:hypothetical protein
VLPSFSDPDQLAVARGNQAKVSLEPLPQLPHGALEIESSGGAWAACSALGLCSAPAVRPVQPARLAADDVDRMI